jgi:transcription elongation factor Elf1
MMVESSYEMDCPHCGKKNRVSISQREGSFNEWVAVHCAGCGLRMSDTTAAKAPKTELVEENQHE